MEEKPKIIQMAGAPGMIVVLDSEGQLWDLQQRPGTQEMIWGKIPGPHDQEPETTNP